MGSKLKSRRLKKIANWDKIFIKFRDYAEKCSKQDRNLDVLRHTRNPEDQKQNLLKQLESGELEYPPEVLSLVCQLEGLEKRFLEKGSTLLWKLSFVKNYAALLEAYWAQRQAFEAEHVQVTKFDPSAGINGSDVIDLINGCTGDSSSDSESQCDSSDSDSDACSASDASSCSTDNDKKKKKERKRRREQKKNKKKKSSRVKTEPASAAAEEPASSSGTHNETTAATSTKPVTLCCFSRTLKYHLKDIFAAYTFASSLKVQRKYILKLLSYFPGVYFLVQHNTI